MVGIRDVAKLAGVSPATVSRVMNETANVNEEKKQRVLKAIKETGFRPNEVARSLYKKSSKIIGMVLPNIENPFMNALAKAVEGIAYENGYRLVLFNSDQNKKKEKTCIQTLEQMNADGIILLTNNNETKQVLSACKIPIVAVDRKINNNSVIGWLQSDHYQGGRTAAEHLIQCGCKKIVNMCGLQIYSSARERFQGYLDVCQEHDIEPYYIECEYSFDDGFRKSMVLLDRYPEADGVMAANDMVAISLYKVLHQRGYSVPGDVQVIGFDNINLSWLFTPEITTVEQPIFEMGKTAAKMIIDNAEGKIIQKENVFEVKLLQRETTRIS